MSDDKVLVSLFSWPGQLLSLYPCLRPKIVARMLFRGIWVFFSRILGDLHTFLSNLRDFCTFLLHFERLLARMLFWGIFSQILGNVRTFLIKFVATKVFKIFPKSLPGVSFHCREYFSLLKSLPGVFFPFLVWSKIWVPPLDKVGRGWHLNYPWRGLYELLPMWESIHPSMKDPWGKTPFRCSSLHLGIALLLYFSVLGVSLQFWIQNWMIFWKIPKLPIWFLDIFWVIDFGITNHRQEFKFSVHWFAFDCWWHGVARMQLFNAMKFSWLQMLQSSLGGPRVAGASVGCRCQLSPQKCICLIQMPCLVGTHQATGVWHLSCILAPSVSLLTQRAGRRQSRRVAARYQVTDSRPIRHEESFAGPMGRPGLPTERPDVKPRGRRSTTGSPVVPQ